MTMLRKFVLLLTLSAACAQKTKRILHRTKSTYPELIEYVEYARVKDEVEKNTSYIVDVRTREETKEGMIPGSINIPFAEVQAAIKMSLDEFQQKYNVPKPRYTQSVIFYSYNGTKSFFACHYAVHNHYKRVANYEHGWRDWVIKKEQEKFMFSTKIILR